MVAPLNHLDRDLLPSIFFSIWTSPFRYIDIEYQYSDILKNIDIDMVIFENINIDIDKAIQ